MWCTCCGGHYEGRTDTAPTVCSRCLREGMVTITVVPRTIAQMESDIETMERGIATTKKEILERQRSIEMMRQVIESIRCDIANAKTEGKGKE